MVNYIDVSVSVSEDLPVWPGSPCVQFEKGLDLAAGDIANDTTLHFSVHTGTHIDAPSHFLENGKSVDQIPLNILIGPAYVVEISDNINAITSELLDSLKMPKATTRLLFKTRNSKLWLHGHKAFHQNFVALTTDAAKWIVDRDILLVGIDYLSIQLFSDGPETHQILLGADVVVIEGLNLSQVKLGHYELFCLPLKLQGIEGAPARVILRSMKRLSK